MGAEGVYQRRHAIRLANYVTGVIDATGKAAIGLSRVKVERAEVIRCRIQTLVGSRAECVLSEVEGWVVKKVPTTWPEELIAAAEVKGPRSSVTGLMGMFGAVRNP
jgi:hypothetical protein